MESLNCGLSHLISFVRWGQMAGRIVFLGVVLGIFVAPVWVEADSRKARHDPNSKLEKMTKRLGLTEEQRSAILPILEEKHQKMQALHEQMKATRQQASEKIEAVLTPEQQVKYKKRREARQKKMREYREKRRNGHNKDRKRGRGRDGQGEEDHHGHDE